LSGFGEFSGRLALSKQLTDAIALEAGVEYARHAGSLKLGGHGENSYADFGYRTVYAQLTLNPQPSRDGTVSDGGLGLTANANGHVPAAVDYERPLAAGQYAVSYGYNYDMYDDVFVHGARKASDLDVESRACPEQGNCEFLQKGFDSRVQALDLLYAPLPWLTIEVQPHLMDTNLDQRQVSFFPHPFFGLLKPDETLTHTSGDIGDTTVAAIMPLFGEDAQRIDASLGVSVPTGSVSVRRSGTNQYLDYGQQLGSGTWDIEPALTYNASAAPLFWGAQASAALRLQDHNSAGYRLGNVYRATAWTGVDIFDWLSATVRGAYSDEGALSGSFGPHLEPEVVGFRLVGDEHIPIYSSVSRPQSVFSPMESPHNYGGKVWSAGFGVSGVVPYGMLAGNRLSLEWLQPVHQNVAGYQLSRKGTLSFSWSIAI
jgi:hypothetical protein